MATASSDIDEIRKRMAMIRREMHHDVKAVVQGAEDATDWRRYVRSYPLLAMGGAFALGYLIVPKKAAPTAGDLTAAAEEIPRRVARTLKAAEPEVASEAKKASRGKTLFGMLFSLAAPVATRMVQGYAVQYMENWLAQQAAAGSHPFAAGPGMPPPMASGRPGPQAPPSRPPGPRPGQP